MTLHQFAVKCERVFDVISAVLLAFIVVSVAWQVFGRYVLGRSPSWTEELCGMLFVWMTMVGSAACLRSGHHLSISTVLQAVSPPVRNVLMWLRDIALMFALVMLGIASYGYAALNSDQESPTLEVPLTLHYSAVLAGSVLMALLLLVSRLARRPIPPEAADEDAAML